MDTVGDHVDDGDHQDRSLHHRHVALLRRTHDQ